MKKLIPMLLFGFILGLQACIEPQESFTKIPPGIWRGVLYLNPDSEVSALDEDEFQYKQESEGELPFNFEVRYTADDELNLIIHNGDERILVEDIQFGRDISSARDTIRIDFPIFDSHISAEYEDRVMEGFWTLRFRENYRVGFKAVYGDSLRFKKGAEEAAINVNGSYQVRFEPDTENEYPAVADFKQIKSQVEGTFKTETGDYRYLEGSVVGQKIFLSCFDGAHAFLFEAKDLGDGKLSGIFKSGIHYTASWEGERSDAVQLSDAYALSKVENPEIPFSFDLPDTEGGRLNLADARFKGKNKIVVVMGSWCPNCKDATEFLKEVKQSPQGDKLEIVSIGFERYKEENRNLAQLKKYKEKSDIPWPVLLGGYFSKKEASAVIQNVDQILSYPTLIVLDTSDMIQHIYTGFSGPATSEYEDFKRGFYQRLEKMDGGE